jgi:RNA polymerase sigma factor (TIGR02999 family)
MVIPDNFTQLLLDWSDGDQAALDTLLPFIECELRRLAHNYMRRERRDHTLQTTAVVNEAYIRLVNQKKVRWQNRAHFFAIAASFMRRILVDYARAHQRAKRGGDVIQVSLSDANVLSTNESLALLELDLALHKLAKLDERKARVVEYRYFGGLGAEEVAEVLKISLSTVERDWVLAKAWLRRETGYEQ